MSENIPTIDPALLNLLNEDPGVLNQLLAAHKEAQAEKRRIEREQGKQLISEGVSKFLGSEEKQSTFGSRFKKGLSAFKSAVNDETDES